MPKTKVTVVDVGSSSISVLIGSRGVNDTFVIHGFGECEYAGYYEGEFLEAEKLKDVIHKALSDAQSSANIVVDKLYVGVPAAFSFCVTKNLTQTYGQKIKLSEQEVCDLYKLADEPKDDYVLISCSPIEFVLDDGRKCLNVVGQKSSKLSATVSLIYAEKSYIDMMNDMLKSLGINVVEYMSNPLCEALYLLKEERRQHEAVVIDCGYIETSVSIVKGEGLVSLKDFSVGGAHVSADLSQCLNITFDEAEQLRKQLVLSVIPDEHDVYEIQHGSMGDTLSISMQQANEISCDRIEMIASLVKKCLKRDDQDVSSMPYYLTGGGISYIKGGKDILGACLGVNDLTLLCPFDVYLAKPHYSALLGIMDKALKQETKPKSFFTTFLEKIMRKD